MAARVSQIEAQKANPGNFLLMHAMAQRGRRNRFRYRRPVCC